MAHDPVDHPAHYTAYQGFEIIQLTEQMNFNRGNAVKYLARAGLKGSDTELEDLQKARWYIEREIQRISPPPPEVPAGDFNINAPDIPTPPQVGDPDPTPNTGPWCSKYHSTDGYLCTMGRGHDGPWHIAGNGTNILALWPTGTVGPQVKDGPHDH